ncbi:hypothetical protein [Paenibacillus sp. 1001270B_150601_E10]|uniref:hypothetical protein n=1 Tax=Paenibacillus sp. 1001270B_150601_E10 TaxID=2787079 RepID=UPI001E2C12A2|nr:hypothetical protein [Paenibacillus sp. 1001270B_150601_E10]
MRASVNKVRRATPPLHQPSQGSRDVRKRKPAKHKQRITPYLSRFTVLWVQNNGVAFDTRGFRARVFNGRRLVGSASFDPYGTVRFNGIRTPTNAVLRLELLDEAGRVFRTRVVPADLTAFVVIG